MIAMLGRHLWFPNPARAEPGEPVALGGDFSLPRLLLAYRSGIFPWTVDPITWWSPDPRGIFELDDFHVPRSLVALLKRRPYEVTCDQAFRRVMEGCAEPAPGREHSWVTDEFVEAYTALHEAGHAHSVECWRQGELVGGVYGVQVGGLFAGESMFNRADGASKIAVVHLVQRLREGGFLLFDIQQVTPTTRLLGAAEIPRAEYLRRLREAVERPCKF